MHSRNWAVWFGLEIRVGTDPKTDRGGSSYKRVAAPMRVASGATD